MKIRHFSLLKYELGLLCMGEEGRFIKMAKGIAKTNAMRMLDKNKVAYKVNEYPLGGPVAAKDVAAYLGQSPARLFKTLVTTDNNHGYYVFCLPAENELDLKKAAKILGIKKIEMLKSKDLEKLTGYIHGGCSPIGMKKVFPTVVDNSALQFDSIFVSGGKIGLQIEIDPRDFEKMIKVSFDDITKE